ncbi:MAG: hypothetical protein K2H53_01855 [Clostridia bacterium]|nr:hypothetical protein [Clostridia bacterium]
MVRVLVFISLVISIFEIQNRGYPERTWHVYNIVLLCYLLTFIFERLNNLLIQTIVGIVKIFIIIALVGLIAVPSADGWTIPLVIYNFIACLGYIEEQGLRFVYWLKSDENQ